MTVWPMSGSRSMRLRWREHRPSSSPYVLEDQGALFSAHDPKPHECPFAMFAAIRTACARVLSAVEFDVLQHPAERPAATCSPKLAERNAPCGCLTIEGVNIHGVLRWEALYERV